MMENFRLPRYKEIPNVGLFLEQVTKYLNEYLEPLQDNVVTSTMISNYVKKDLLKRPYRKQYDREQIATLLFICVVKNATSLENVRTLLEILRQAEDSETIYDVFCEEFENIIEAMHNDENGINPLRAQEPTIKTLLHNVLLTVANKAYLEMCFTNIKRETQQMHN